MVIKNICWSLQHACICHIRRKHQPIFASTISTWQACRPPPAEGSADYSRQPKQLGLILISFRGFDLRVLIHPDSFSRKLRVHRHWRQTDHTGIPYFRVIFMLSFQLSIKNKSFMAERERVLHLAKLFNSFKSAALDVCHQGDLPSMVAVTIE